MFDLAAWMSPLAGENPSGEGLRNDPKFHEIERLMQPQVEVSRDERNNPVSQIVLPVEWSSVMRKAEELRAEGRDLRLLVIVVQALANENGLRGLADGLTLVAETVGQYWDTVHPELRPGLPPREAALRRTNALQQLQGKDEGALGDLRRAVFFAPRAVGPITGKDLERGMVDARTHVAETLPGAGEAERAKEAAQHEQLVSRVRVGCADQADKAPAEMAALIADGRAAVEAVKALEAVLADKMGPDGGMKFTELTTFLTRVVGSLERGIATATKPGPAPAAAAHSSAGSEPAAAGAPEASRNGQYEGNAAYVGFPERLTNRDDVVKCLDLIIAFYDRTEPSSPIPHLARRVRRMVHMDFLELMEDLAPSGLKEFRMLAGVADGKKTAPKEGDGR